MHLNSLGKNSKKSEEQIDSKKILTAILSGEGTCQDDVEKLVQRGYKEIHIDFSENEDNSISASIYATV